MTPRVAAHIGYHKTATTWLQQEILPRHAQIASFVREHPGQNPLLRQLIMEPDRSFAADEARAAYDETAAGITTPTTRVVVISNEHLSGHAGTGGYDAFRTAGRLQAALPEARVFFVVREQVSMVESEYRQLVFEGTPAKFDTLLHRSSQNMRPGFDLAHYEYDRLADRYVELFGRDRVALFDFRAVITRPQQFLDQLATFLEIDPWPALDNEILHSRVNATLPRRLLEVRRRLNHLQRSGLNPYPPVALKPFWRSPLWILATRLPPPHKPFVDADTAAWIRDRFKASNARLASRYGIDFGVDAPPSGA